MVRMVETLFNRKHLLLVTYKRFILELLASIKLIFHTVCHRAPCNNVFFKKKEKKVYLSLCHRHAIPTFIPTFQAMNSTPEPI